MAEAGTEKSKLNQPLFERISRRDVAVFSRQLSLLLDVGMPLLKALRTLGKRTSKVRFKKVINDLAVQVEQGSTFANSLAKYPRLFPDLYVNIVKVGEVGGSLELALRRLAEFTERELRHRSKLFYAMMYPFVVVMVAILVIVLILVKVFPVLLGVFEGQEEDLPQLTRSMAAVGDFIGAWWPALLIGIAVLAGVFLWFRKTPFGRRVIDSFNLKFRLPIVGRLGQKTIVARLAETFSLLLKSGIQLIPAMRVVATASGNVIVEENFTKAANEVEQGRSLQDVMIPQGILPPIVVDMLGVGEEAGSLDTVLDRIHESYSEEVEMALENMNRIIEPILLVFLGGAVLLIALAFFLPYWNIDEALTFE